MKTTHRLTFREIVEASRAEAAASAWERASFASRIRHGLVRLGHHWAAQRMGETKARS